MAAPLRTRAYAQRARAQKAAETRDRILGATRELLPDADRFKVEDIARRAGVSIPTLYAHFGSKSGLLSALLQQSMREAGLNAGFDRVWASPDGETALRTMLDVTLGFWQEAWSVIEFLLRVRRMDPELGAHLARVDESRLGHLEVICRRLREEGRLMPGVIPSKAARLAFALSTPYVYEALSAGGSRSMRAIKRLAVDAAVGAIVRPGSAPIYSAPINWAKYGLRPPVA